jgi:hypothetical protein
MVAVEEAAEEEEEEEAVPAGRGAEAAARPEASRWVP